VVVGIAPTHDLRDAAIRQRRRDAMHGRLADLGVCRPATRAAPRSRHRERIRDWGDWRALKRLRRRAWSADPDTSFEFDGDISGSFDAPDD